MTTALAAKELGRARIGETVGGRYVLVDLLGEGGLGTAYLAEDRARDGRRVVVKLLARDRLDRRLGAEILRAEFDTLARLRHPNLVEVYDLDAAPDAKDLYYTLEHVAGVDIVAAAADCREGGAREAAFLRLYGLIAQAARALDFVHAHGYAHFDIAPRNLLVTTDASGAPLLKILDFGAARADLATPRRSGTARTMAPEVIRGEPADRRADLYSLGATLYEAVTGRPVFEGEATAMRMGHLRLEPRPPSELNPSVPPALEKAILRLLRKDPAERFQAAFDFAASLELFAGAPLEVQDPEAIARRLLPGGLVERDAERRALEEAVAAIEREAGPRIALVRGVPGMGKTALLRDLARHALTRGVEVIDLESAPRDGVRDAIRHAAAAIAAIPSARPAGRELAACLARDLAPSAEPPPGATAVRRADGVEPLADRLADALAAAGAPILVTVDDADAADPDLALALGRLVRMIALGAHASASVAIVLAARDELRGPIADAITAAGHRAQRMDLTPLSRAGIEALVANTLGRPAGASAAPDRDARSIRALANWLDDMVGGIPLHLEDMLRALAERGAIHADGPALRVDVDAARSIELREGTAAAFTERIARLPAPVVRVAEALAVFRRPADLALLAAAAEVPPEDAAAAMTELERRGVTRYEDADGASRVGFRHRAYRAALLARIPRERRMRIHDIAAEHLAAGSEAPRCPADAAEAAYHALEGSDPRRALDRAVAAARELARSYATIEAADLLRRALAIAPEGEPRTRALLLEDLGRLEELAGRFAAARSLYEDARCALEAAGAPPADRGRILVRTGSALAGDGDAPRARESLIAGLRALPPGERALRADALMRFAFLTARAGRAESGLRIARRALRELDVAEEGSIDSTSLPPEAARIAAQVENVIGTIHDRRRDYPRAAAHYERAQAWARAAGDAALIAQAGANSGRAARESGETARARRLFRAAARDARRAGLTWVRAAALLNRGVLESARGRITLAAALYGRARDLFRAIDNADWEVMALNNLGWLEVRRGGYGRAEHLFRDAIAHAEDRASAELKAQLGLGTALLLAGDGAKAEEAAARALALTKAARDTVLEAEALELRGRIHREALRLAEALDCFEQARALRGAARDPGSIAADLERAEILIERNATRPAAEILREAAASDLWRAPRELRARAAFVRGRLALARGREARAAGLLAHSFALGGADQDVERAWRAASLAALAHERLGDHALAQGWRARAAAILRGVADKLPPALEEAYRRRPAVREALAAAAAPGPSDPQVRAQLDLAQHLLQINRALARERDPRRLLERIMDCAIELVGAERGFLVLRGLRGKMKFEVGRDIAREDIRRRSSKISHSMVDRALREGRPVVADDARHDAQWSSAESVLDLQLTSVLCVPLRSKDESIGVIYVDARRLAAFTAEHVSAIEAFADQAALAIETARLLEEHERARLEVERLNRRLEERLARRTRELTVIEKTLQGREDGSDLRFRYEHIVGRSRPMMKLLKTLDDITDLPYPVLITGESGTGKELVARAIHYHGQRRKRPFVPVNCAAFSESLLEAELFGARRGAYTGANQDRVGLLEVSSGGTLFLDEVGDMGLPMQTKLLRAIEHGEVLPVGGTRPVKVDLRIIAATNKDLRAEIEAKRFRGDFFFRLNVLQVHVPPLRERREDIPLLVAHFLKRIAEATGAPQKEISGDALDLLCAYDWPGNVRELAHEIQRASALAGPRIEAGHLSRDVRARETTFIPTTDRIDEGALELAAREAERRVLLAALARAKSNKSEAARLLGISRYGLLIRLKRCGL